MKLLVDTNIILEVLLGQNRKTECWQFLNWLALRGDGVITSFSVHAIEAITGKTKTGRMALRLFLQNIENSGIEIYTTSLSEERAIVEIANTQKLDFDDALQYFAAKKLGAAIVSLDKDFDPTDIEHLTPREALLRYR